MTRPAVEASECRRTRAYVMTLSSTRCSVRDGEIQIHRTPYLKDDRLQGLARMNDVELNVCKLP
jgi:hypothetical protein